MKAFLLKEKGLKPENFEITEVSPPTPREDDILVKVVSAALNPVDWKMAASGFLISAYPLVLGADVSGTVEAVGSKVTRFQKGDVIYGYTQLGHALRGPFAEYALVSEKYAFKKGDNISFEEAAAFPVGVLTASLGLFNKLVLPLPSKVEKASGEYIVVWGGSSAVGSAAVQLATAAGFKVIATASPRNFEFVKSIGATHVIDYKAADVAEQIKAASNGTARYGLDAIGEGTTTKTIIDALSTTAEGHVAAVSDFTGEKPANVTFHRIVLGVESAELEKFFLQVTAEVPNLIAQKKVVPLPVEKLPNGLAGVYAGLEKLKNNQVSAAKLVVNIAETPQ